MLWYCMVCSGIVFYAILRFGVVLSGVLCLGGVRLLRSVPFSMLPAFDIKSFVYCLSFGVSVLGLEYSRLYTCTDVAMHRSICPRAVSSASHKVLVRLNVV